MFIKEMLLTFLRVQPLSRFVYWCRSNYGKKLRGSRSLLSDEHERRLREIGFEFDIPPNFIRKAAMLKVCNAKWEKRFNLLLKFKEKYGHLHVPRKAVLKADSGFGEWCHKQVSCIRKGSVPLNLPHIFSRNKYSGPLH